MLTLLVLYRRYLLHRYRLLDRWRDSEPIRGSLDRRLDADHLLSSLLHGRWWHLGYGERDLHGHPPDRFYRRGSQSRHHAPGRLLKRLPNNNYYLECQPNDASYYKLYHLGPRPLFDASIRFADNNGNWPADLYDNVR